MANEHLKPIPYDLLLSAADIFDANKGVPREVKVEINPQGDHEVIFSPLSELAPDENPVCKIPQDNKNF